MARKDVDLVIRAKDEAASVVDTITKALNEFISAQATLDTRAKKTESSLGQLGSALSTLDKTFKGVDVGAKLAKDLNAAAASLARIETEVEGTQQAVKKLSKEFDNAEAITGRYAAKLAGATQALDRQKASVAKAKTEQKELSAAYNQATSALEKIAKRQAELPGLIDKQSAAVTKIRQKYADLAGQLEATQKPSATLAKSFQDTGRRLAEQESKLASLKNEYGAIDGKLRAAGAAATIFGAQSAQAATALAKQERALGKIATNYSDLTVKTRAASQQQGKLEANLDTLTGTLNRQTAVLDNAEQGFVDLAVSAGQADAALEKLSAQSIGSLKTQLDQQRRAMLEAKREYVGLTEASSKLAAEIGKAGVPTREMAQAFAQTKAEAALAKAEYQSQRETLLRMGQAFRDAGTDIESIRAVQAAFVAQLEKQGAITASTKAKIDALAKEYEDLYAATNKVSKVRPLPAPPPAKPVSALAQAYRQLYGDSRKALSIQQRLRGEVLSLVAAYGGLYGVINLLGQVVTAYQTLEAAQARLNVANDGDFAKTANDLDFLRRSADRLGVDLGTLAQEYSKFSIATKGTNLEGANTRKIFLSVAEAARVNRSSNEELSGVFVALTQIVSKGAVQMEELRQQLGDRLPGALQIMADGLGVTTSELIKMLVAGKVTSDALVPFAEELDRRFGPGLGEALAGTTVALGRLKNAAFQALVQFGKGGFIDSFTKLANDLTELLQSADFEAFVNNLSAAVATLVDAMAFLARNFRLVVAAAGALAGLKLAPVLIALAAAFGRVQAQAAATAASMALIRGAVAATGGAAATAAGGVGLLAGAMRALLSTTGVGLLIAAVGAGIALWGTNADAASEAMNRHIKIMDDVKNAYDLVGGSVEDWRKAVEGLTVTEAKRNLDDLIEGLESARRSLIQTAFNDGETGLQQFFGLGAFVGASQDYNRAVDALIRKFSDGEISATELLAAIDEVNQTFDDGSAASKRYGEQLVDAVKPMVDLEAAIAEAENVLVAVTGTTEEAAVAIEELNGGVEDAADTFESRANTAVQNFTTSMEALKELLPAANGEMSKLEQTVSEIDTAFQAALKNARAMPDAIMRIAAEQQALATANQALMGAFQLNVDQRFGTGTSGVDIAAEVIRGFEGFRATPYYDVNAYRVGFGSDTITLSDGTIQQVVQGMTVSVADANRDLLRRITTEFMPIAVAAAGESRFSSFTPQQQAALTSIAYNYGEIPDRIAAAVRSGTTQEIAAAIQGLAGDNGGVNRNRRLQEAALFQSTAGIETQAAEQVRLDEERQRQAEREAEIAADQRQATQERLADGQFELSQQELILQGKERQAAIEEAIRQARAEDPNITQAELDAISEQTGRLFDLEQQQENLTTAKERAEEAERTVNDLLAQRAALTEQLTFAQQAGDTAQQDELRQKIAEVNAELSAAITNAQEMWAAVGGSGADAAIAKLGAAKLEAQQFGQQATNNYLQWNRVADLFVNGLSSAFNKFSEAVANGEDPMKALRDSFLQFAADFLIQIAQMIIQQAIFNALQGAFGGTSFGSLIGLGHTGGIVGSKRVGSGNQSRKVNPTMFSAAARYHSGGIVGLQPGEVPIIAKQGEAVLTEDDPFHPNNRSSMGSSGSSEPKLKVVNGIDSASFLEAALNTDVGERVLLNWLRANSDAVSNSR